MTAVLRTAEFLKAAKIQIMDRIVHPNWEYISALERKLSKGGFRRVKLLSKVSSVQRALKENTGTDMAFYVRKTRRELSHIDLTWGSNVRDPSSILINFSSGFNDDNAPHVQGLTTFYHYMNGDPSAAELVKLIGKPDAASSLRAGLALEAPEPPKWSPEMNLFFDTQVVPLISKLRL